MQLSVCCLYFAGGGGGGGRGAANLSVDSTQTVYFTAGGQEARGGGMMGYRLHWGVGGIAGTGYG